MDAGIYTLFGTALGGIISVLTTCGVTYYTNHQAEAKRVRDRRLAIKVAARLVEAELTLCESSTRIANELEVFVNTGHLKLDSWHNFRTDLAADLTDVEWDALMSAYKMIEWSLLTVAKRSDDAPSPNVLDTYRETSISAREAMKALQKYSGTNYDYDSCFINIIAASTAK